jgi:Rod binding domain-containing protein
MKKSSLVNIIGTSCQFKRVENMKREAATWDKDPANDFMVRQYQQMLDDLTQELAQELLANGWGFSEIADFIEKLRNADYDRENEDALVPEIERWVNEAEQMAAA